MRVLIIVDLQNDFCPGGALPVAGGHEIVEKVNSLMRSGEFDVVIATRDYHPRDHVSFAENHPGGVVFQSVVTEKGPQILWPTHCVKDSYGSQLHPLIDKRLINHIVLKGTDSSVDSYSGFFDNARENETPLRAILEALAREREKTLSDITVSVCGLALDYCVAATARDAASLGLRVEIVRDATRAVNPNPREVEALERALRDEGVLLRTCNEILPDGQREPDRSASRPVERGLSC